MNTTSRYRFTDELGPLFVVLIWGLNFPLMKAVLAVLDPNAMNVIRIGFSTVALALIHARIQQSSGHGFWAPLRISWKQQVAVGLLGYFLYQFAFIAGLNHTTAGSGALLMASAPIWTGIVASALGYESMRRMAIIGLTISIAGTVLVVFSGRVEVQFGESALLGNLIMLAAALCWGSYTALNRPLVAAVRPTSLTFFAALISMVPLTIVGAPYLIATDWSRVTWAAWLAVAASGILSTGLATVLWNNAVRSLGASHTAAFGNAVPVVAVAASALLLSEPVTAGQLIGGALIIGGLFVMRRSRRNEMSSSG